MAITVACVSGLLRVKREPSVILGLTRSGKDKWDESEMQTLLVYKWEVVIR